MQSDDITEDATKMASIEITAKILRDLAEETINSMPYFPPLNDYSQLRQVMDSIFDDGNKDRKKCLFIGRKVRMESVEIRTRLQELEGCFWIYLRHRLSLEKTFSDSLGEQGDHTKSDVDQLFNLYSGDNFALIDADLYEFLTANLFYGPTSTASPSDEPPAHLFSHKLDVVVFDPEEISELYGPNPSFAMETLISLLVPSGLLILELDGVPVAPAEIDFGSGQTPNFQFQNAFPFSPVSFSSKFYQRLEAKCVNESHLKALGELMTKQINSAIEKSKPKAVAWLQKRFESVSAVKNQPYPVKDELETVPVPWPEVFYCRHPIYDSLFAKDKDKTEAAVSLLETEEDDTIDMDSLFS